MQGNIVDGVSYPAPLAREQGWRKAPAESSPTHGDIEAYAGAFGFVSFTSGWTL